MWGRVTQGAWLRKVRLGVGVAIRAYCTIVHRFWVRCARPIDAASKIRSASIDEDLSVIALEGVHLVSDETRVEGEGPRPSVRRDVRLSLGEEFFALYPTDDMRIGRLKHALSDSIALKVPADCQVESIRIEPL